MTLSLHGVALACACLVATLAVDAHAAAPAAPARHADAVSRALAHLSAHSSGPGRPALSNTEDVQFEARDVIVDADGTEHVRFAQRYRGLRVIGGDAVVHSHPTGHALRGVSRTLARQPAVGHLPSMPAERAGQVGLEVALAPVAQVERVQHELVVFAHRRAPALAWDVLVAGTADDGGPTERHVFVDAHSGAVLDQFDTVMHAAAVGSGQSLFIGTVPLDTDSQAGGGFALRDTVRGGHAVYDLKGQFTGAGTLFTDADNTWGDGTTADRATVAVDAAAGHAYTWDYYLNVHGRRGIANDGKGATSKVHQGLNGRPWVNALWSDSCFCMSYGDGDGSYWPLVALDIAGHEMTHGVTSRTAGLLPSGESGGLNEATSDILGSMVEFYANRPEDPPDYLIGERLPRDGSGPLRTMIQPSADGASADCWYPDVGDLNAHYASGVGNHFFYLLAEGSQPASGPASPTCQAGDTRVATGHASVKGVGRKKAEKIWYRALSVYMTSSSDYHDARDATLSAAADLYGGSGSKVWKRVKAAWAAVNVK
ncbi:M4 family metallopeptidase [Ideonella sp. DXS29W]|uniref:Neutral metalloproteinase n=1 Tax=Ideonella lacteola TaxID=2984193 RepID=A0ABU9BWV7_9BURK